MISQEGVISKKSGFLIDSMLCIICAGEIILLCGTVTQWNVRILWQTAILNRLLESQTSIFSAMALKANRSVINSTISI